MPARARTSTSGWLAPPARFLGDVSFALYAVHWALIDPFKWLKNDVGVPALLSAVLYIGTGLILSWCAVKWFDEPVRRRLSAYFHRTRKSSLAASTA